jgi:uncharacterized protein (TIGR02265 family)
MDEEKVKGTMLLDFVKMIRANRNLDWDKHLKAEDWEVVNSLVLPAKWYPVDVYKRCSYAAFVLLADSNLEAARANGQSMGRRLFENTYKSIVQSGDPGRALKQYVQVHSSFFNFGLLKFEMADSWKARIHLNYNDSSKSNAAFCYQMQGLLEALVRSAGGTNDRVAISAKQWEGAPATVFEITWE